MKLLQVDSSARASSVSRRLTAKFAEEWQKNLVVEMPVSRFPVDIEISGIGRRAAPFEHIEPPQIVCAADAHMIGDEIDDVSEPMVGQHRDHVLEAVYAA